MLALLAGTGVVEGVRNSRLYTRHLSAALGTPLQGMFQEIFIFRKMSIYRFPAPKVITKINQ